MVKSVSHFEAPRAVRTFVRAHESSLIPIAALIGAAAGLLVSMMSGAVNLLHVALFRIPFGERLSSQLHIDPRFAIFVPMLGGLALGASLWLLPRWRPRREVDPIEANALHGGQMSFRGSIVVALQTVWSSGIGGSVGLEAGYTQIASGIAASIGRSLHLRRADQRIMVGCGAAAAIAGAFGAPLAGAFYAFELILGGYTPMSLTPVGVSAVTGYAVAQALAPSGFGIFVNQLGEVHARDLFIAALLGLCCALFGIGVMRGVTFCESLMQRIRLWVPLRTTLGGLIVGLLALATPQVLSSGHGALHLNAGLVMPLTTVAAVFVLKSVASVVSLGTGFRGGLFFASLLLGSLGGQLFAEGVLALFPTLTLDPDLYTVIGMSALSASVIGGPLTMSFIALEATGNLWLTTAVLIAVIVSTQITRELFGYSFATWRLHLRGETIRSAADVGWIRNLTVAAMMRPDVATIAADASLEEFRARYPLGSTHQVIAVDASGRYAGIVPVAEAHRSENAQIPAIGDLMHHRESVLLGTLNVQEAMALFDHAEAEALAVVDNKSERHVIGLLTEAYAMRRYVEESERNRRQLLGER